MTLVESIYKEIAVSPVVTTTRVIATGSEAIVPRGARGTLLAVHGSIITVDDNEQGFASVRLIASVNTAHREPYALMAKHIGIILIGTPTNFQMAAPTRDFDKVFISQGRGVSILSRGARSNDVLGWSISTNGSVVSAFGISVNIIYEYVLEWLTSGATGDWPDDQDEEFSMGEG